MSRATTTKTERGTCPACFHKHDVDDGLVHRHGWREQGNRRVGEYGRAWHTGACFGVGRKPFEVSPEGTWAFLAEVVYPAALADGAVVAHLLTRPILTVSYTFDTGVRDTGVRYWKTVNETRSVLLAPGATVKVSTGTNAWDVRTLTYEHEWNALLGPLLALYTSHGEQEGANLLRQLLDGKLTTDQLDDRTEQRVAERAKLIGKLHGKGKG